MRHLKGTRDKGIVLKPDMSKGLQCFVDADFSGGYSPATPEDPLYIFSLTLDKESFTIVVPSFGYPKCRPK